MEPEGVETHRGGFKAEGNRLVKPSRHGGAIRLQRPWWRRMVARTTRLARRGRRRPTP